MKRIFKNLAFAVLCLISSGFAMDKKKRGLPDDSSSSSSSSSSSESAQGKKRKTENKNQTAAAVSNLTIHDIKSLTADDIEVLSLQLDSTYDEERAICEEAFEKISDEELKQIVNKPLRNGLWTLLNSAIYYSLTDVVQRLIKCGVDVSYALEQGRGEGKTPLHLAARSYVIAEKKPINNADIIDLLLAAGADINKQSKNGETPLHSACMNEYSVRHLLLHGADPSIKCGGRDAVTYSFLFSHGTLLPFFKFFIPLRGLIPKLIAEMKQAQPLVTHCLMDDCMLIKELVAMVNDYVNSGTVEEAMHEVVSVMKEKQREEQEKQSQTKK